MEHEQKKHEQKERKRAICERKSSWEKERDWMKLKDKRKTYDEEQEAGGRAGEKKGGGEEVKVEGANYWSKGDE